ncbi:SWIM zinc finger family protein [uncultured Desulfovibrio sp.]|uniref:SWIM zinc finger family protein n=1 Tax=uncultured Desulfovibrio sp. TaxID=167968 RepID=UPI00345C05E2
MAAQCRPAWARRPLIFFPRNARPYGVKRTALPTEKAHADFSEGATPVLRCTCPSRQLPCKHCRALLFEILEGKPFAEMESPPDILKKRARRGARLPKRRMETATVRRRRRPPPKRPVKNPRPRPPRRRRSCGPSLRGWTRSKRWCWASWTSVWAA